MREDTSVATDISVVPVLSKMLARNVAVLEKNAQDLSDAQSYVCAVEEGSHLHWLLGHLIVSRDQMLKALQQPRVWSDAEREQFGGGSQASKDDLTLEALLSALKTSQAALATALETVTEQTLTAKRPNGMCTGDYLEFLVWHETYHIGQSTLYRRAAGLKSPIG